MDRKKNITRFDMPHWCPNCRVYIESFAGPFIGLARATIGSPMQESVEQDCACTQCKQAYHLRVIEMNGSIHHLEGGAL